MKNKILVALRVLLGLAFAAAGLMKLLGSPTMVAEFNLVGLGQWFRYFTGVVEIAGAILLIPFNTVAFGAGLLICVGVGAAFAKSFRLHGDVLHTIVFAGLLLWVFVSYLAKGKVTA